MTPLGEKLRQRIEASGAIPVEAYMAACLGDPEFGYYRRAAPPIGREGDFITAPEISQMFGELIGLWAAAVWMEMRRPSPCRLVEFGPGRGTLMADALRAARSVPGFLAACNVHLVEISSHLRAAQRAMLSGHRVTWHDTATTLPAGPRIVLANEFFDALPVRQTVFRDGRWRERCVGWDGAAFVFTDGAVVGAPPGLPAREPEDGDIYEFRPAVAKLVQDLTADGAPFALLAIDYGHRGDGFGDTVQAVARHGFVNPLERPGEQDMSAHVNFAELAQAGAAAGLQAFGPMPMGLFLLHLGIGERLATLVRAAPDRADVLTAGVRRLTSPHHMGELFQVMALATPPLTPPPFQDRTDAA